MSDYDVLILPEGRYGSFSESDWSRINDWVSNGGKLIAIQGAIRKLVEGKVSALSAFNSDEEKVRFEELASQTAEEMKLVSRSETERYQIREYVAGAIFRVRMDASHPLAYGYQEEYYSLKTSEDRYGYLPAGNVGVIRSSADHLSGFAGNLVLQKIDQSLVFGVEQKGAGQIVHLVDDPLFRSFWHSGKLLFTNAVFYVDN